MDAPFEDRVETGSDSLAVVGDVLYQTIECWQLHIRSLQKQT